MSRHRRVLVLWIPPLLAAGVAVLLSAQATGRTPHQSSGLLAHVDVAAATTTASGPSLYAEDCASCHGNDGRGTNRGPSLEGVGMAAVDFQLSTGRMPRRDAAPKQAPYVATLRPDEIAALDQYVTDLVAHGGPGIPDVNPAEGDLARGGQVFRQYCAACHSQLGAGGELVDQPAPALTESTPRQAAEAIRAGAVYMPSFGTAAVSQRDLDSIVAYLQYLKHPEDRGGNPLSHLGPVAEGMVTWFIAMVALLGFIRWTGQRG